MPADTTPNNPNQTEEPGTGTLVIRVFASDRKDQHDVVRRVRVHVTRPKEAGEQGQVTDVTNDSDVTDDAGELVLKVPAGRWNVEATAFGTPATEPVTVQPNCESYVTLVLPINLGIYPYETTEAATDTGRGDDLKFYRAGTIIKARAECAPSKQCLGAVRYRWTVRGGSILEDREKATGDVIHVDTSAARGPLDIDVTMMGADDARVSGRVSLTVAPAATVPVAGSFNIGLRRSASVVTPDLPLWVVIRNSTDGLSFKNYQRYMDVLLCNASVDGLADGFSARRIPCVRAKAEELGKRRFLPFSDSDAYRLLKVATEAFVTVHCGVALTNYPPFDPEDLELLVGRTGVDGLGMERFERLWKCYLERVNGSKSPTLPYLALIASKFPDARIKCHIFSALSEQDLAEPCLGLLGEKLSEPCLVELIWSYWHEEAMLVQSINAISLRFQNRLARNGDPLVNMELSPLRPLNNLLWGYIQDEQHRLSVMRRGDEYDHQYGLRLEGRAAPHYRTANRRSQFLGAFHNLLHLSSVFYQKDDNTMVLADAFPVLNALKEVHLILSQGAHNQFGDLPVTARVEMLMQQWLLARPEFAEFLPTRAMVAYPEPWMDRVDAMKKLQGWSDVNVLHFRDLGVFGEKLLLTIRYGSWVEVNDADQAKNWLRAWRPEIQGYIHAYRAVTGVDVTTEPVNSALPSTLLQRRLAQQPRAAACLCNPTN